MDIETLKTISDTILVEGKEVIATWLEVVSSGHKGITLKRVGFQVKPALPRTLRFMLYMCFVSVSSAGRQPDRGAVRKQIYELVSVLDQFIGYLARRLLSPGDGSVERLRFAIRLRLHAYSPLIHRWWMSF